MDFQPISLPLEKVVRQVSRGEMVLPEFQREFVWTPSKVAELLDSVSRGWPIGTLLLLAGPQKFAHKGVVKAPPPAPGDSIKNYILDGQQRVSALFHAIADVSDAVYFVDFRALAEGREYIDWQARKRFQGRFPDLKSMAASRVVKVCDVYDAERFHLWQRHLPADEGSAALSRRENLLPGLRSRAYRLMAVQLDEDIQLDALARIFETINRTGVKLNAFDLMVAVLYPDGFNLRDEWADAKVGNPILTSFDADGVEILKLIALWRRRTQLDAGKLPLVKGVKQSDVLATPSRFVADNWNRAVAAYCDALIFAQREFGMANAKFVPSSAMLLTLAYMRDMDLDTELSVTWFWSAIKRQTYAHGANTQVLTDIKIIDDEQWSELSPMVDHEELVLSLLEPVRRNGLLLSGVACALAKHSAKTLGAQSYLVDVADLRSTDLETLRSGSARRNTSAPIASQFFAAKKELSALASSVRKGNSFDKLVAEEALASQGWHPPDSGEGDRELRRRAEWLASLLGSRPETGSGS